MKLKIYIPVLFLILGTFISWSYLKGSNLSSPLEGNNEIEFVSGSSKLDNNIYNIKKQLRHSENTDLYTKLGAAYLQKARETNDPIYYSNAEDAFEEAIDLDANNANAAALLASVYLSRHEFKDALELGSKALSIDPYSGFIYSVIVDAQVELGMYNDAIATAQKMVDTKPDLTSYSRVSYIRELHGDLTGAIDAMQMAINAGSPAAENTAWCKVQLGNLYYTEGQTGKAEEIYNDALLTYPDYIHAIGGLAKIQMHNGNYAKAIELYSVAVAKSQLPEYLIALGDAYKLTGNNEKAAEQYEKVKFVLTMYKDNGIETDLELAIFNADHNRKIDESIEKVEESFESGSRSIKIYHAYAWLNYKKGDYAKAEKNINEALKLNTKDPLMLFHAARIYEKIGMQEKSNEFMTRALQINPFYSTLYMGS